MHAQHVLLCERLQQISSGGFAASIATHAFAFQGQSQFGRVARMQDPVFLRCLQVAIAQKDDSLGACHGYPGVPGPFQWVHIVWPGSTFLHHVQTARRASPYFQQLSKPNHRLSIQPACFTEHCWAHNRYLTMSVRARPGTAPN